MIVQTGPMVEMSCPPASRRCRPRSTASATARHCGTVNDTVALMLIPRAVASSIASMPARVAGILTIMLGASASNRIGLFDDRRGVLETGADRSESTGARCGRGEWRTPAAATPPRRSTTLQPPPRRCRPRSPAAAAHQVRQCAAAIRPGAIFKTMCAITGLHVAPTPPCSRLQRSSSRSAESFHRHVAVVCVISWSGLFHAAPVDMRGIIEQLRRHSPSLRK